MRRSPSQQTRPHAPMLKQPHTFSVRFYCPRGSPPRRFLSPVPSISSIVEACQAQKRDSKRGGMAGSRLLSVAPMYVPPTVHWSHLYKNSLGSGSHCSHEAICPVVIDHCWPHPVLMERRSCLVGFKKLQHQRGWRFCTGRATVKREFVSV